MIVLTTVLAVICAVLVVFVVAEITHGDLQRSRRDQLPPPPPPPPPPPVDHAPAIIEAMRDAIVSAATETSKAIGSAVQAAMSAPVEPPRPTAKVWQLDPDVRDGTVDDIDPTDLHGWLARNMEGREDVAMLRDGESPIPGVELRQ